MPHKLVTSALFSSRLPMLGVVVFPELSFTQQLPNNPLSLSMESLSVRFKVNTVKSVNQHPQDVFSPTKYDHQEL